MTDKNDSFGDRMKLYEMGEAGRKLMPLLPVMVRLDGRGFSRFTKGLERPFSTSFHHLMVEVTKLLLKETNAVIGYTQSDEISLVLHSDDVKSQLLFDGRIQKLTSILAALASVKFAKLIPEHLPTKVGKDPMFDCRVWNVPTKEEAANAILWRERDATKNAVSMAARAHFSHSALQNKRSNEMQAMLLTRGVNFNDYPDWFKRGTFVRRTVTADRPDEALVKKLESLGKKVPLYVERSQISQIDMPPFGRVVNRVSVIFNGADPQLLEVGHMLTEEAKEEFESFD